jgi:hypothetical protein
MTPMMLAKEEKAHTIGKKKKDFTSMEWKM